MILIKFELKRRYIVIKVEDKKTVNLYTLIDIESADTITTVGVKNPDVDMRDLVDATLSLKTRNERVELKNGEVKFYEVANTFIQSIKKVK